MDSEVGTTGDSSRQGDKGRPHRRWRYVVLMLLALFGVMAYRTFRPPEAPLAEAITPDGKHRIRVIAIGVGDLDYHPDSSLHVWIHSQWLKWAPRRYWTWIPGHRNVFHAGKPTKTGADPLQILMDVEPLAANASPSDQAFDLLFWYCEDSHGAAWQGTRSGGSSVGTRVIQSLENFPRRDQRLKLRLIDGQTFSTVLAFECPNPAPLTGVKEWPSQALPATESSSAVTCTLKGWTQDRKSSQDFVPEFVIEPRSPLWEHNDVSVVTYEDATGNFSNSSGQLSPFEPTWKVRASAYRTVDAEFAADEQWQARIQEIPPPSAAVTIEGPRKIGSTTIKSVGVKGRGLGMLVESEGRWTFSDRRVPSIISMPVQVGTTTRPVTFALRIPWTDSPYAVVDVEGVAPEDHLILVVRDQDGEVLGTEDSFRASHRIANHFCRASVYFTPRKTSKQLTVTVAISRPEVFQFYVKPPEGMKKTPKIWE